MKTLFILVLASFIFAGCGQVKNNQGTAHNVLASLNASGHLDEQDLNDIEEVDIDVLKEELVLTETDKASTVIMKLGKAELLIEFMKKFSGKPNEIAMIINGIKVTRQIAANPEKFQALIAALVAEQLEGLEIKGIPLKKIVELGLNIVKGNAGKLDFAKVFGVLIKGAFKLYLASTPYGMIFDAILSPVLDAILGGGQPSNNNTNNNLPNNVVNAILDSVSGNPPGEATEEGGLLNLISNLFE